MKNTIWFFSFETLDRMRKNIFSFFNLFLYFLKFWRKLGILISDSYCWNEKKQIEIKQNINKKSEEITNIKQYFFYFFWKWAGPGPNAWAGSNLAQLRVLGWRCQPITVDLSTIHMQREQWRGKRRRRRRRWRRRGKKADLRWRRGGAARGDRQQRWWFVVVGSAVFLLSLSFVFRSLLCFFFFLLLSAFPFSFLFFLFSFLL